MKAGVYPDLDERTYHADADSISASGIKRLLKSPAHYRLSLGHTPAMDLGSAVHTSVLGVGAPIRYIDASSWRGVAAGEEQADAYANGQTPLLVRDRGRVEAMTANVRSHPSAGRLLSAAGRPELSMFWNDPEWGIQRRCRWDYLTNDGIGIDLKTTSKPLDDYGLTRTIVDYGYHVAADWYLTCADGLEEKVRAFALIFVSSQPPHDVRVVDLSDAFLDRGRELVDRALATYRQCVDTDTWPAYTNPAVTTLSLPRWAEED